MSQTSSPPAAGKPQAEHQHDAHEDHHDIIYPDTLPFVGMHLAAFAAIWTGVTLQAVLLCVALYFGRMFFLTAGYHRYFSHRSYKTSRVGQFVLAFMAQTSTQKSILWWAAQHRHHHKHSDTEHDVHSPHHGGFLYSHVGWIFDNRNKPTDHSRVPDLAKYPELRFLDRFEQLPAVLLALGCFLWMGWVGLVVGFVWSTVILYHGTFFINSVAHVVGKQRYITGDESRNNWWLSIITLGEGWHNNHHAYQSSTRQGFRWYEIDPTYYVLKALSWVGLVWDLREPPAEVVRNERPLGRRALEQAAQRLADRYDSGTLAKRAQEALARNGRWEELRAWYREGRESLSTRIREMELPEVPSFDDLWRDARRVYASSPSLEDVVTRARELLHERVAERLAEWMQQDAAAA